MTNSNSATLPDPDFSWDPNANPPIAGLRPHRAKSYRLEPEILANKQSLALLKILYSGLCGGPEPAIDAVKG